MSYRFARYATACLIGFFVLATGAMGQSSSATISGRVLDPSGQGIPDAGISLVRTDTGDSRTLKSGQQGEFVFASLQPGTYDLVAKAAGFKNLDKKGLVLSASEHVSAGELRMQIGAVTESVE